MASNVAGMIGSMVGMVVGLASLANVLTGADLTAGAYIVEVALWAVWSVLQGTGFLILHSQTQDRVALVSFILGIIAALAEIGVIVTLLGLASIGEHIVWLMQNPALHVGVLAEALYAFTSGIALLHMSPGGATSLLLPVAGALFILLGRIVLAAGSISLAFLIPFLLVAANVVAFRVFSSQGHGSAP